MKRVLFLFLLLTGVLCGCRHEEISNSDLSLADIHGPVRTMQKKSYTSDRHGNILNRQETWNIRYFEFDRNERIVKGFIENEDADASTVRFYHNAKNQIDVVQIYSPTWDVWFDTEVNYDEDERVSSANSHSEEALSNITFTYDEEGLRTIAKEVTITGDPYIGVTRYRILETDSHGNWIRQLAVTDYNISGEKTREYRLDVRTITYY